MSEISWPKRIWLLSVLCAICLAVTFWRDIQDQFSDFVAPAAGRGGVEDARVEASCVYYFAGDEPSEVAPFDAGDLRTASGVDGRVVTSFRLRARKAGAPYPTLVLAMLDEAGHVTRSLVFAPSAYAHAARSSDEMVRIAFVALPGEHSAMVRPVDLKLRALR